MQPSIWNNQTKILTSLKIKTPLRKLNGTFFYDLPKEKQKRIGSIIFEFIRNNSQSISDYAPSMWFLILFFITEDRNIFNSPFPIHLRLRMEVEVSLFCLSGHHLEGILLTARGTTLNSVPV